MNEDRINKTFARKYINALINETGAERREILGITRTHYSNMELAEEWYYSIRSTIDKAEGSPEKKEALNVLYWMYVDIKAKNKLAAKEEINNEYNN